jgi:hypothetical protein
VIQGIPIHKTGKNGVKLRTQPIETDDNPDGIHRFAEKRIDRNLLLIKIKPTPVTN